MEEYSSVGSERALLSSLMFDMNQLTEVDGLKPEHFSISGHRYIFLAMKELYSQDLPPDASAIYHFYTDESIIKDIDDIGGLQYLFTLKELATGRSATLYAERIHSAYTKKIIAKRLEEIKENMTNPDVLAIETLTELEKMQADIGLTVLSNNSVKRIGDGVRERVERLKQMEEPLLGLKTPWVSLNLQTLGMLAGELTVIAGRAKLGKSSFLLGIGACVAYDQNVPVLYIDTEMYEEEQENRILSLLSGVEEWRIKTGEFSNSPVDIEAIERAMDIMDSGNFYHVYMPQFTPEKVATAIKQHKAKYDIGLVIFDYIKLGIGGSDKEYLYLGELTTALKEQAGKLRIPILTAVQLNRQAIGHDTGMDESMVAGSDKIVQFCNRLIMIKAVSVDEQVVTDADIKMKIVAQRSKGKVNPKMIYFKRHGMELKEVQEYGSKD